MAVLILIVVLVVVVLVVVVLPVVLGYRARVAMHRVRLLSMVAATIPVDCGEQGRGLGWPACL